MNSAGFSGSAGVAGSGALPGTGGAPATGTNLLTNGDFSDGMTAWTVEKTAPATATSEVVAEGPTGENALKVTVTAIDPTDAFGWHVQAFQPVGVETGLTYTRTFWAKADPATTIP
jgi:hypothetical protein